MALEVVAVSESLSDTDADVLVVGATTSAGSAQLQPVARELDDALEGRLSEYLKQSAFKAKVGETIVVPTFGRLNAGAIAVVGLGDEDVDAGVVRRAAGSAARKVADFPVAASVLHVQNDERATAAAAEGFHLGSYRFTSYKSDARPPKLQRILFLNGAEQDALASGGARARAATIARDLVNEPASTLSPDALAERARAAAETADLELTVFDESDLAEKGFGGLLGVARGSDRPPRLIQLTYRPADPKGKVVIVGKGVTFDSGGLSLKDAKGMETMKTDMAGGAAVIGAMSALGELGVGVECIGLVPATDNMPSGDALRPGDVITHYGGKTSEVLNTDAEGRLILADALAFASELKPNAIVDAATLTGAMMVALGKKVAGYFSNNDELAAELEGAAEAAGERLWRMPLVDDYRPELDSDIADIKNIGQRWGGAIFGALYLRDFVDSGIPWGHIDMAGPARADNSYDEVTKGGSGMAARTLLAWAERRGR